MMFVMTVLMAACSNNDNPITPDGEGENIQNHAKTVLVYMAGRNSLSDVLASDLQEIKEGSLQIGEDDNLLVFVRRYNDSEQPWLARIKNGMVTDSVSLDDMGIVSSDGQNRASDPLVMEGVMHYAFSHYPATNDNYGLVLWGHACGWLFMNEVTEHRSRAYGLDNGSYIYSQDGRWINITTLAEILKGMPHMKFIMADCCNFMCLENLYELRTTCDYIIGSPAEIPDLGAPYEQIVPDMFADGAFYSGIIGKYYSSVSGTLPLSVVKTSEMDNLAQATRQAVQAVKAEIGDAYPDMTGIIHYYFTEMGIKFYPEYCIFYDAGDFIHTHAPEEVYQQWRQALNRAVVDCRMADRWDTDKIWRYMYSDFTVTEENYHGVSMFVSQDPSLGDYARYNEDIRQMEWYSAIGGI